jgi:hypothetical protein
MVYWQAISSSDNANDFQEYLHRYPSGQFALAARNRLAALQPPPGAAALLDRTKPFEGKWTGDQAAVPGCPATRLTLYVSDGTITGSMTQTAQAGGTNLTAYDSDVRGKVNLDGTGTVNLGGAIGDKSIGFTGDRFELHFSYRGCELKFVGVRSP